MSGRRAFIDTNLLVYIYGGSEPEKSEAALRILDEQDCHISTQVLNELSNVCIKKLKLPIAVIENALDETSAICHIRQITSETVRRALRVHARYGFAYYDCLIIASALEADCSVLYSEDMHPQKIDDSLSIENPFAEVSS